MPRLLLSLTLNQILQTIKHEASESWAKIRTIMAFLLSFAIENRETYWIWSDDTKIDVTIPIPIQWQYQENVSAGVIMIQQRGKSLFVKSHERSQHNFQVLVFIWTIFYNSLIKTKFAPEPTRSQEAERMLHWKNLNIFMIYNFSPPSFFLSQNLQLHTDDKWFCVIDRWKSWKK